MLSPRLLSFRSEYLLVIIDIKDTYVPALSSYSEQILLNCKVFCLQGGISCILLAK